MRGLVLAAVTALFMTGVANAANEVPNPVQQEILIKTALMTLNDANLTGNYAVLHARLSKPFREQFNPDKLKQAFKVFADQKADWSIVVARPPVPSEQARIDDRGALLLRGYFDTQPNRVFYDLDFVPSEGEWKVLKLNVSAKPAQ